MYFYTYIIWLKKLNFDKILEKKNKKGNFWEIDVDCFAALAMTCGLMVGWPFDLRFLSLSKGRDHMHFLFDIRDVYGYIFRYVWIFVEKEFL